uniref:Putative ionotropic receptor n=1 Tax=Reticulitermes speratus TaxID=60591 RepID=A0A0U5A7K3_9NEOP
MQRLVNVCFLLLLPCFVASHLPAEVFKFVEDYFTFKSVRIISCFTCSKRDSYQVTKYLMSSGKFWMVSPDPEQPATPQLVPIMKNGYYYKFGVFLDYDCRDSKQYLDENSARRFINASFNWLVWSKYKFTSEIDDLSMSIDTEMTWAYPDTSSDRIILHDLYKINYSWPINGTLAGHWTLKEGVVFNLTQYKYSRRQDLRGIVYTAALVVNNIPTTNLEEELVKPENRALDSMATYNYRGFLLMQQMYNFSKRILHTNTFGYVVEGGKPDGLVRMMKYGEAEVSISALKLNHHRIDMSDFCPVPTWELRICAMFRHPQITDSYGVLLKPFEPKLWLGCGLIWFLMMVALRFISFFESQYHAEDNPHEMINTETEGAWTWSDTLVIITGAVSQQGSTMDSKWITGRIVFLNTHILALMMNVYYSAFVVSSLLSAPTQSIHNTRDLIDSSLAFGAEDINYNRPFFEMSADPLVQELYQKRMAPPHTGYYSRETGLHKVLTEPFVFHTEAINVYKDIEETFTDEAKCDLTEILIFPIQQCYPFVPRTSPLKELLTYGYRKAVEGGLFNYMNRHWRPDKPPCSVKTEFRRVGTDTIVFAVWLLGGGLLISAFICMTEIILRSSFRVYCKKGIMKRVTAAIPQN